METVYLGKKKYEVGTKHHKGVNLRNVLTGNIKYDFPYRDFDLCKTKQDGFTRPDSIMADGGYLHWRRK